MIEIEQEFNIKLLSKHLQIWPNIVQQTEILVLANPEIHLPHPSLLDRCHVRAPHFLDLALGRRRCVNSALYLPGLWFRELHVFVVYTVFYPGHNESCSCNKSFLRYTKNKLEEYAS